jgi:predicted NUDIX family NTP pyrophosphohydrolase
MKRSAGLLMYRRGGGAIEVLLAHPGGPHWVHKDLGAWSLPKGEYGDEEEPLAAARREFEEETGFAPAGPYLALGELRQPSGKRVAAWAFEGDCDPAQLKSNEFEMEWPPRSGKMAWFPEMDRAAWFTLEEAARRITRGQRDFLRALERGLAQGGGEGG